MCNFTIWNWEEMVSLMGFPHIQGQTRDYFGNVIFLKKTITTAGKTSAFNSKRIRTFLTWLSKPEIPNTLKINFLGWVGRTHLGLHGLGESSTFMGSNMGSFGRCFSLWSRKKTQLSWKHFHSWERPNATWTPDCVPSDPSFETHACEARSEGSIPHPHC